MKKKYTKPVMSVVLFEVNESVAACAEQIHQGFDCGDCEETELGKFLEAYGINFTVDMADCTNPTEWYCYYTATGSTSTLFNS